MDSSHLKNQVHPLLTPVILNVLFEHLPIASWKVSRLVHTTWYGSLLPRWREEMFVTIGNSYAPTGDLNTNLEEITPSPYKVNTNLFREKPFQNVRIYPLYTFLQNEQQFWKTCGQWMKRLHIDHFDFIDTDQIRYVSQLLFELTPNLEEFKCSVFRWICNENQKRSDPDNPKCVRDKLKSIVIQASDFQSQCPLDSHTNCVPVLLPICWMDIFSVFQQIEKLDLSDCKSDSEDFVYITSELINAIVMVKSTRGNSVLNFKELQLPLKCPNGVYRDRESSIFNKISDSEIVKTLCHLSMPLHTLTIDVTGASEQDVTTMIKTQGATLRKLTLGRYCSKAMSCFQYRLIPDALTKLVCCGNVFPNLSFLAYVPNLKEFGLVDETYFEPEDFEILERIPPLQHLTKLKFAGGTGRFACVKLLKLMIKLMPNVTDLIVKGDHITFESVCQGWPKLKHLTMDLVDTTEQQFVQNVIKLQHLQSFSTPESGNPARNILFLSETAICEGLLKLPMLKKVVTQFVLDTIACVYAVEVLQQKVDELNYIRVHRHSDSDSDRE